MEKEYVLKIPASMVQTIGAILVEAQYKVAAPILALLQQQITEQDKPQPQPEIKEKT